MIRRVLFDGKVEVGISEISDGNMRFFDGDESVVIRNLKKLSEFVGLEGDRVARLRVTYKGREDFTEYKEITEVNLLDYMVENAESKIPVIDGLVVRKPGIGILLPLADCLAVVAFDEKHGVLGLLHAGRHNIEQDGPRKFVEYLVNNFGSNVKDLKFYFSPYAVNFPIYKLENKGLAEATKEQLVAAGASMSNILDPKIDTVSNANFPSYSSGDASMRFAIIAKLV